MNLNPILLFLFFSFISCNDSGVEAPAEIHKGKITTTININGSLRSYIIHIPQSYTGNEAVPILFAFHGLGGSMNSSYNNSKFYEIAEDENLIVVHPNGISSQWDAVSVDNNTDVDFIEELIIELQNNYNINYNRIYSCGMSNGGYFSFLLACKMPYKIAGIASVTGLMFQPVLNNCQPSKPIPILQIHGTNDQIVNYENVDEILNYWIDNNNTNITPIVTDIADTNTSDRSTVELFRYTNGDNNVEVHHFKVNGGRHKWPGYQGNMDINASAEIWNFLKQYDINGKL